MRANRRLIVIAAAILVLAGGAVGAALALTSSSGERLASVSFPGYDLSFRYPAAWTRIDWCWTGTFTSPITVLTSGGGVKPCRQGNGFSPGSAFPPPQLLRPGQLTVSWLYTTRAPVQGVPANTRIGGRPANVRLGWKRVPHQRVITAGAICGRVGTRERTLVAEIPHVVTQAGLVRASALICGPNFAVGENAVRRMLATVHFIG